MGSRGIVGSAGGVEAVVSAIGSPKYCRGSWTLPISTLSDIGQIAETLEVTRLEVLVVLPPAVKPAERRLS